MRDEATSNRLNKTHRTNERHTLFGIGLTVTVGGVTCNEAYALVRCNYARIAMSHQY